MTKARLFLVKLSKNAKGILPSSKNASQKNWKETVFVEFFSKNMACFPYKCCVEREIFSRQVHRGQVNALEVSSIFFLKDGPPLFRAAEGVSLQT
jgi:hypothetical protein